MVQVVKKFFINYEKKEAWLNKMAAKGLNLLHYSFEKYVFKLGVQDSIFIDRDIIASTYQSRKSNIYKLSKGCNVEYVDCYMRWVYFRKKASEGEFDLYSDYESKFKHY